MEIIIQGDMELRVLHSSAEEMVEEEDFRGVMGEVVVAVAEGVEGMEEAGVEAEEVGVREMRR